MPIPRSQLPSKPGLSVEVRRGYKWGDIIRWNVTGWQSVALDDPNEPLRINSPLGWRGSVKYPFGRPWIEQYGFSGADNKSRVISLALAGAGILFILLLLRNS